MPGEEGQVEASVKHLKSSFVAPRDLDALGLDGARKELVARLRNVADVRRDRTGRLGARE